MSVQPNLGPSFQIAIKLIQQSRRLGHVKVLRTTDRKYVVLAVVLKRKFTWEYNFEYVFSDVTTNDKTKVNIHTCRRKCHQTKAKAEFYKCLEAHNMIVREPIASVFINQHKSSHQLYMRAILSPDHVALNR